MSDLRRKLIRVAHANPEIQEKVLPIILAADYQEYVEKKKRKNEKPLSREKWEARMKPKAEPAEKKKQPEKPKAEKPGKKPKPKVEEPKKEKGKKKEEKGKDKEKGKPKINHFDYGEEGEKVVEYVVEFAEKHMEKPHEIEDVTEDLLADTELSSRAQRLVREKIKDLTDPDRKADRESRKKTDDVLDFVRRHVEEKKGKPREQDIVDIVEDLTDGFEPHEKKRVWENLPPEARF